jgi:hypothetical protein
MSQLRGEDLLFVRTLGSEWLPRGIDTTVMTILVTPFRFVKALVFHEKLNRG